MRVPRRIVGAAVAGAVLAGLVGAPAGSTRARAVAAEQADAAEGLLTGDGVPIVVDGYVPPDPDCSVVSRMMPLFAAGTVGAPTPRGAVLVHVRRPGVEESVDPSMVAVEIGRVHREERRETWALVHDGGSVTTLTVGPAPAGGWIVEGTETCVVRPA